MSTTLNRIILMGVLGRDPEITTTATGKVKCTLSVGTNDGPKVNDKYTTQWHTIIVWGKTAENCGHFLKKGRLVLVEGRLTNQTWDDPDGKKRKKTFISARTIKFLGSGKDAKTDVSSPSEQDQVDDIWGL